MTSGYSTGEGSRHCLRLLGEPRNAIATPPTRTVTFLVENRGWSIKVLAHDLSKVSS